jgi:thiol-disulfide isomerase/thioredoxin
VTGARAARVLALGVAAAVAAAPVHAAGDARPARPGYVVVDLPAIKKALKESRGHAVLVHFWATWCSPCLEELPVMEKFAREMKPRGVQVMSLSLDDPDKSGARVSKVLSEVAPSLTPSIARIADADDFISQFDRDWEGAIPAVFGYDAQGQLRGRLIGEATRRELDQMVARLLKK